MTTKKNVIDRDKGKWGRDRRRIYEKEVEKCKEKSMRWRFVVGSLYQGRFLRIEGGCIRGWMVINVGQMSLEKECLNLYNLLLVRTCFKCKENKQGVPARNDLSFFSLVFFYVKGGRVCGFFFVVTNRIWIWCEKWLRRHENVSQRLDSKCVDSFLLIKESVQFI